jgi:acetyltransferase-like isoleucine patch superfamily enzyme
MKTLINNRRLIIFLYSSYSYCSTLLWLFLDLMPHFVRGFIFRFYFKKFGKGGLLDYRCFIRYPWRVSIGNNVDINRGCELYSSMQTSDGIITLEDNVVLGPGVVIFSSTHDYNSLGLPDISAPVKICRYVWVGGKSIILPGVVIGEGAVIGAGSVVTKDIPPYCVAVGNPAKVIKKRVVE